MIAKDEKIQIDDKTLTIIAKKADGALRDAESYFDQVVAYSQGKIDAELVTQMLNLIDEETYFQVSDAVLSKDYKVVFQTSEKIFENGWDFIDFMNGLVEHFRNILSAVVTNSANAIETAEIFKSKYLEYRGKFSESDLLRLLNFLNKSLQELRFSQNQKLKIEITLSHLLALESSKTISDFISAIKSDDESFDSFKEPVERFIPDSTPSKKKADELVYKVSESYQSQNQKGKPKTELVTPIVNSNIDFDEIVNKWKSFIESVSVEKGLTLAPALNNFQLISLSGNNLSITTENEADINTFKIHEKYLAKKSEEYFGHRFNYILNSSSKSKNSDSVQTKTAKSNSDSKIDPYEEIIINELSGEKIG
jgi:DNA polymerase-3 subunit gamma/tau